jgi:hypothetical protein
MSKRTARHQRTSGVSLAKPPLTGTSASTELPVANVSTEQPVADPLANLDTVSLSTALVIATPVAEQPAADQPVAEVTTEQPADQPVAEVTTEQPADQPVAEVKPDPFADLPTIQVAGVELPDLSKAVRVSDPRKYSGVHATAVSEALQTKKGWKYANVVFRGGTNRKERKPTSVHGMIQDMLFKAGKDGIPAPVLVSRLRMGQVGNRRSHFCEGLPPVGWAEGWIDSAVTQNIAKVAGQITAAQAAEMAGEAAEPKADAA